MPWLRLVRKHPETVFAILALILGGGMCFLIPPGAGFDEITHLARMWEISGGALVPNQKFSQGPYLPMAFSEVSYRSRFFYTPVEPDYFQKFNQKRIDWNNFTNHITRSVYFPLFYLPQAVAVGLLGRALDAPVLWIYYLSRLLELLGYVLMVFLAIRWIPFGKWILAYLALAPMALFQAATISTDPYTNGASFLFIAWVLYLSQRERISWKQIWVLLGLALLLFSSKVNTAFLVLLLLLLPVRKFPSRQAYFTMWAGVAALFGLVVIGWNLLVYSNFYMNVPGYGISGQLAYILGHPLQFIGTFFTDLAAHGRTYLVEWVGIYAYNVGRVPPVVYPLNWLGLAAVWLLNYSAQPVPLKTRVVLVASALVGAAFTITMLYLAANRISSPIIEGVQGRYFILVAPLFFLGLVLPHPVVRVNWLTAAIPFALVGTVTVLVYMAGLYLSFYVTCGTSSYTPGLCYQPPYKNWAPNAHFSEPVTGMTHLSQTFTATCGPLASVRLWSRGAGADTAAPDPAQTTITVRESASGEVLASKQVANSSAPDKDWLEVSFDAIAAQVGQKYAIEVTSPSPAGAAPLSFGLSERREYMDGQLSINGSPVDYDLLFQYGCKVR